MRKLIFLLALLLAFPATTQAASDVIATYKYADGSMVTICTRDSQHVRMDTSPDSYLLLSDGKVYSVTRTDDGKWTAMDMQKMAAMASGMGSMFGGGIPEYDVRYEKTSKTEKIAGYSGKVYNAQIFEDGKLTSKDEVVLCTHANLKKLTHAWIAVAESMSSLSPSFNNSIEEAKKLGYGGILRYGKDMTLASLKVKSLNASYYQLPKGTQQAQVPQAPKQQNSSPSMAEQDAKEIGQEARDATKDELKDEVRSFIQDLF